jgi:S1-C subfamily serine protease
MLKKFLALLCIFNLSCAGLDYKRSAYNSVAMVKFETIDPKTKDDSYITGTAFAVDENYLVTAAHVCVSGVQEIVLKNLQNFSVYLIYLDKDENVATKKDFKIVEIDRKNDLCLIYKQKHGLKPVILNGKEMKIRDPVFAVGAPASTFPIESEGFLSLSGLTVDGDQEWPDVMLMSLDICGRKFRWSCV